MRANLLNLIAKFNLAARHGVGNYIPQSRTLGLITTPQLIVGRVERRTSERNTGIAQRPSPCHITHNFICWSALTRVTSGQHAFTALETLCPSAGSGQAQV
jgi:hypothetical protein